MDPFRIAVVVILLAILVSLATALYHLTTAKRDPSRMVRALTWRVGLSVALFALLLAAAKLGWIAPRGFGH